MFFIWWDKPRGYEKLAEVHYVSLYHIDSYTEETDLAQEMGVDPHLQDEAGLAGELAFITDIHSASVI